MAGSIEAGKAFVRVQLKNDIKAGTREIQAELARLSGAFRAFGALEISSAMFKGLKGIIGLLSQPIKIAADIQAATTDFEALSGSALSATRIVNELRQFAAQTSLKFEGLASTTSLLLGYGDSVQTVVENTKLLGAVARGDQDRLGRIALAFGQIRAQGRLMATELRQLTEAGFNPLQEISRTTGKSMGELMKVMSEGGVRFDDVRNSLISITSAGGRFFGFLEKRSQTLKGLFDNLIDNVHLFAEAIAKPLIPALSDMVRGMTTILQIATKFAQDNKEIVLALGGMTLAAGAVTVAIGGIGAAIASLAATKFVLVQAAKSLKLIKAGAADAAKTAITIETVTDEATAMSAGIAIAAQQAGVSLKDLQANFVLARNKGVATLKALEGATTKSANTLTAQLVRMNTALEANQSAILKGVANQSKMLASSTQQVATIRTLITASGELSASNVALAGSIATADTAIVASSAIMRTYAADILAANAALVSLGRSGSKIKTLPAAAVVKSTTRGLKAASKEVAEVISVAGADGITRAATRASTNVGKGAVKGAKAVAKQQTLAEMFKPGTPQVIDLAELVVLSESGKAFSRLDEMIGALTVGSMAALPSTTKKATSEVVKDLNDLVAKSQNAMFEMAKATNQSNLVKPIMEGIEDIAVAPTIDTPKLRNAVDEAMDAIEYNVAPALDKQGATNFGAELLQATDDAMDYTVAPKMVGPENLSGQAKRAADLIGEAEDAVYNIQFDDVLDEVLDVRSAKTSAQQFGASVMAEAVEGMAKEAADGKKQHAMFLEIMNGPAPKNSVSSFAKITEPISNVFSTLATVVASTFGKIGTAARAVVTPIAAIFGGGTVATVGAYVAVVAALAGGFTYLLNRAGLLKPMFEGIKATFNDLKEVFVKAFGGISDALAAGEYMLAAEILWSGVKLAFYKGVNAAIDVIPQVMLNGVTVVKKLGMALINTFVDIFKSIPALIKAYFTGQDSITQIIYDIFTGNFDGGEMENLIAKESKNLDTLTAKAADAKKKVETTKAAEQKNLEFLEKKQQTEQQARDNEIAAAQNAALEMNRQMNNITKGVHSMAAGLSDEAIQKANQDAAERVEKLREESRELMMGKQAAEQYKLAATGVTTQRRAEIAVLQNQVKFLEAQKKAQEKATALQIDIAGILQGEAAANRLKLAQEGLTTAQINAVSALEAQKAFVTEAMELSKGIQAAQEQLAGDKNGERANARELAAKGLNAAQIQEITLLGRRKKALEEQLDAQKKLADDAKTLKDNLKSPLEQFQYEVDRIRQMVAQGLLTPEQGQKAIGLERGKMGGSINGIATTVSGGGASMLNAIRGTYAGSEGDKLLDQTKISVKVQQRQEKLLEKMAAREQRRHIIKFGAG
jgi:tape measure domain-containing protein